MKNSHLLQHMIVLFRLFIRFFFFVFFVTLASASLSVSISNSSIEIFWFFYTVYIQNYSQSHLDPCLFLVIHLCKKLRIYYISIMCSKFTSLCNIYFFIFIPILRDILFCLEFLYFQLYFFSLHVIFRSEYTEAGASLVLCLRLLLILCLFVLEGRSTLLYFHLQL